MKPKVERVDHAIARLSREGDAGRKIAGKLGQMSDRAACLAHPDELPSVLTGHDRDGFRMICAACMPPEVRAVVEIVKPS